MEPVYVKRFIKTVDDLPKEDGWYFVAKKDALKSSGLKPLIYTIISKNIWLKNVAFYLEPVEMPTDTEIKKEIFNMLSEMKPYSKDYRPTSTAEYMERIINWLLSRLK